MSNFKKDLADGQIVEQEVAHIFTERDWQVSYNDSKSITELGGWDLQVEKGNKSLKIEVKNDLMSSTTGNVAIEMNCLERTVSEVWVYKFYLFIHALPNAFPLHFLPDHPKEKGWPLNTPSYDKTPPDEKGFINKDIFSTGSTVSSM